MTHPKVTALFCLFGCLFTSTCREALPWSFLKAEGPLDSLGFLMWLCFNEKVLDCDEEGRDNGV